MNTNTAKIIRSILVAVPCATLAGGALAGCTVTRYPDDSGASNGPIITFSDIKHEQETHESQDKLNEVVNTFTDTYNDAKNTVKEKWDERQNATPTHVPLGQEVNATDNLAISVLSVEAGPYDHLDKRETMKATVLMRNLTDHVVDVKASNWDADTADGTRVDHKYRIFDEDGNIIASSFDVARISPHAIYTGEVYFDGTGLVSVVYEPHWLVSAQNEYIYFDVG